MAIVKYANVIPMTSLDELPKIFLFVKVQPALEDHGTLDDLIVITGMSPTVMGAAMEPLSEPSRFH